MNFYKINLFVSFISLIVATIYLIFAFFLFSNDHLSFIFLLVITGVSLNMQPNFIFIGTDKSGSTWLYNLFLAADQVYVPDAKDIYFFDLQLIHH